MDTNLIKKPIKRLPRRRFSGQFKVQIVKQSLEPGTSLSALALANGLNSNQVFKWRRDYLQQLGKGPGAKPSSLLSVVITTGEDAPSPVPASPCIATSAGHMDVTLRHGQIRIEGVVDAETLRTLVHCLRT